MPIAHVDPGAARAIRWFAAITGMLGGVLLASNTALSGWGFVAFAFSSLAWVVAGRLLRMKSLVAVNCVLLAINLLGIYRWLL